MSIFIIFYGLRVNENVLEESLFSICKTEEKAIKRVKELNKDNLSCCNEYWYEEWRLEE